MSLSARFEAMEAKRAYSKPVGTVMSDAAVERRDVMESRRRVGRQTQLDARRHNMANAKPAMRAAQAKVVAPRHQQQPPQRQRPYQGQQRPVNQQGRGRGRAFQGSSNRAAQKTGGMPPRGNSNVKTGSRGPGVGKAASSGDAGGRGNNAGRGRGRGRGGGRGRGPGGRSSGKTDGRGAGFKKPEKEEDLDQGLDEYWFKAGKGPDPQVASLDRSLDSYWNQAKGSNTATGEKMETEATGGPASAPVPGDDPEL